MASSNLSLESWHSFILESLPQSDDLEAWENHFEQLARFILLECTLVVDGSTYFRINEIEFYYHGKNHPDVFTHQHPKQCNSGTWYFHSSGASYRGGTFKGLDLTCAAPNSSDAGGILLRGMVLESTPGVLDGSKASSKVAVVQGSCLLVDRLLQVTGSDSVADLADHKMRGDITAFNPSSPLHLIRNDRPRSDPIYRSARVGLFLKKKEVTMDQQYQYVSRRYRFVTLPKVISKGRALLFAGIALDHSAKEACKCITATPALIQRFRTTFENIMTHADDRASLEKSLVKYQAKSLDEYQALELFILLFKYFH